MNVKNHIRGLLGNTRTSFYSLKPALYLHFLKVMLDVISL